MTSSRPACARPSTPAADTPSMPTQRTAATRDTRSARKSRARYRPQERGRPPAVGGETAAPAGPAVALARLARSAIDGCQQAPVAIEAEVRSDLDCRPIRRAPTVRLDVGLSIRGCQKPEPARCSLPSPPRNAHCPSALMGCREGLPPPLVRRCVSYLACAAVCLGSAPERNLDAPSARWTGSKSRVSGFHDLRNLRRDPDGGRAHPRHRHAALPRDTCAPWRRRIRVPALQPSPTRIARRDGPPFGASAGAHSSDARPLLRNCGPLAATGSRVSGDSVAPCPARECSRSMSGW